MGEFALRVNDFDAMTAFYKDVVGLEVFNDDFPDLTFFKVGKAVEGHPQLFALFDRGVEVGQEHTTIDHFAFLIELSDYEHEKQRLEGLGLKVVTKEFPHFHWRSLFFADPEGNTVELVSYDPSV